MAEVSASGDLRVLLIDRDEDTRQLYARYLKLAGCDIDEAYDGRDGLVKALSRHYDVIVTDTRVPGIDGYQLCDLLRGDPTTHVVPIIVITGEAYPGDLERARRAGANVVLVRPCLPETLLLEIRRVRHASRNSAPRNLASFESTHGTGGRRTTLSRAHRRGDTTTPPAIPPTLVCPACDQPLAYQRSHVGGVSDRHPEQWDYYQCPAGCGTFQYRQRTRKLRPAG